MAEDNEDEGENKNCDNKNKIKIESLKVMRTIGTGKFSRVLLCQHETTTYFLALKLMVLEDIVKCKQVTHVNNEKRILSSVKHPFIVNLVSCTIDTRFLYFVLPFIPGGELFSHLRAVGRFSCPVAQFYTAEVVSALSYLHSVNIVYRDLKPENLLLDKSGHIKIVDFGLSKYVTNKTRSICGTPEYVAPEILINNVSGYGVSVEWWSPVTGVEEDVRNFVECLLVRDVNKRLGCGTRRSREVRGHPWLKVLNWEEVDSGGLEPPFVPHLADPGDSSQYPEYSEDMWWDVHELPVDDRDRFVGF